VPNKICPYFQQECNRFFLEAVRFRTSSPRPGLKPAESTLSLYAFIHGIDYRNLECYGANVIQNIQVKWGVFWFCLILTGENASAQGFSDMFAGSQLLTGISSATITGSNTNATEEPGEPKHARKIGGHSVWISWLAPGDGLVTLSTTGSSFDTLLAVYVLDPGNDPPLERLDGIA
jgi:hypothetical protein